MPAAFQTLCSIQHQELGKARHLQEMHELLAWTPLCVSTSPQPEAIGRIGYAGTSATRGHTQRPVCCQLLTLCASVCTLQAAAGTTRVFAAQPAHNKFQCGLAP